MPAETVWRVERNTEYDIDAVRRDGIRDSLRYHAARPQEIPARLAELDREWDTERAIAAGAATLVLAGLALTALVDRRFVALPSMAAGFLLQHALQGWCPPVTLLRSIGFRTRAEICKERCGLERLRGECRPSGEPAPAQWTGMAARRHEAAEA